MGAPTTELTTTAAEQVLAIEEIKRVFAMRLRVMDTKQWDLYGTVHTDDVVSEFAAPRFSKDGRPNRGPKKFAEWTAKEKRLLVTDTTFRDAHQSLLATRMRTENVAVSALT